MTILEQLRLRVELASKNLRNELLAANQADAVLPVGDIRVDIVEGGVRVYFTNLDDMPPLLDKSASMKPVVEKPVVEKPVVEKPASAKAGKSNK